MPEAGQIRVDLTGAPQTMLATLYAKALDADADHPILGDTWAKDVVSRIDYDWRKTTITARTAPSVTIRTAHMDNWARDFLAANDRATVLHLGCGLDSRVFRINPGPGVEWYDVDCPDVITLRAQLYPARDHCHPVPASVTDPAWLPQIPADRPALMVAEGLTMYLTEDDGVGLLRRIVEHFASGELQFDVFNRLGIKLQVTNAAVRRAGAKLYWGIDGPDDIIAAVPGVRLREAVSVFDTYAFKHLRGPYRPMGRVMSLVSATRNIAQFHRYAF
ncbi:class I SAM-dependent methyltransferase [Mycobacterium sp.]|uniref:class I SAM-dependent methyltransferase n=1 Tax=Mycobacterium sp. TaxID=1785 RepID=UPI002D4E0E58|nr:class I SAM-dependent methyltransferase [Mycobacterium sp.]HZA11513.1 class I SAM-dependent methyltransferase [Mycobacterium sp.]